MITKSIPNLFTLGNLFLGMLAMMLALDGRFSLAAIMVIVAMLLDGLDGRVARALNCQSEFGKQLDSLSDIISFGIAPALIMYLISFHDLPQTGLVWVVTAIFPMCGALRLARFNVQKGIPGYFIGLPIPAAGGVLATLSLFHKDFSAPYFIISMLLLSYLMVSSVKYPNFKKLGLPRKAVAITPFVVILAVAIAVMFPEQISKLIFVPLVLYAGYGLKQNVDKLLRRKRRDDDDSERAYRPKR
ncbi:MULTISPECIES: CDP-diacylglycerol--serine O-phosphatidyltransferase [Paenibacillus]|uniref:CDP-diacylglycerol--serine O-phosphatidyltransferase n=1 Tax=Paenibacillus vini TaxID=1476024 RepID=A0ABQ4MIA9_9BACL|nr:MULTISPECIES: CDP-diacylglycerol--serine O-phosphatidyltransferase [Paenibacillus]MBQ4901692.1 CDP-diacylglycerol--serine O-phosphatidyltransferase [Paenibacillus sp. Marseille-P2973]MDN4069168.1 CDP-diacylglycerol--serine O-phosphatidyltransferase [Paenibacillus vini]GIP55726.1 CDP-diacylglycerol--serine O-phosphatidyltransferase [Paenibacillus vini]